MENETRRREELRNSLSSQSVALFDSLTPRARETLFPTPTELVDGRESATPMPLGGQPKLTVKKKHKATLEATINAVKAANAFADAPARSQPRGEGRGNRVRI